MSSRHLKLLTFCLFFVLFASLSFAATRNVTVASGGGLVFDPKDLTINVGDTVRWTWAFGGHSTTSTTAEGGCNASGLWDSGILSAGATFDFTFDTVGDFPYKCTPHCTMGMTGVIRVSDFNISCTPNPITIDVGDSGIVTCTITSVNGFNSPVDLNATGLPAGVTFNFVPDPVTPPQNNSADSTLTLNVGGTVPPGSYPFTVSGTNDDLLQTFNMTLIVPVPPNPDFNISCIPTTFTTTPGGTANGTCTVTSSGGFNSAVDLGCTGLPAGATCAFVPNPVTPPPDSTVNSALTMTVGGSVAGGSYPFQVTGTSGAVTNIFSTTLQVQDFTVTSSPSSLIAPPGGSATSTTTVTAIEGFNSNVDLDCTGLPTGITCGFNPDPVVPTGSSTLTVNVDISVPEAVYNFQITGTDSSLTRTFDMSINVTTAQDFQLSCNPTSVTANRGSSGTTTCTVTSINSYNTPVDLACSGLPTNVTCTFNPPQVMPPPNGSIDSILTVNVGPDVAIGSYPFQADATDGTLSHSTNLTLNVEPLFIEDFEDGIADNFTFLKGTWAVSGGVLSGTNTRKATAEAPYMMSGNRTVEAEMRTAGGIGNKVSLLGWRIDKKTQVEVLMKEEQHRWVLKHRIDGQIVIKAKALQTILPNTDYCVRISYDGTAFQVFVDGVEVININGSVPSDGVPGFRVKATTGTFGEILVY
ncbi:plastocyanin/azurin family copper-binding protein [bacterium]|nr:plastocyanin/azurin family copper-binding protein [bacterium]